jgi:hypothetical protein
MGWLRRTLTWKRVIVIVVAAALSTVAVTVVHNITSTPHYRVTAPAKLPPVQQQQPQSTPLQQVEKYFGRFQVLPNDSSDTPDTQAPAVLLVDDGSGTVSASQSTQVSFSPREWTKQDVMQIQGLTVVDGYATFRTDLSTIFVYTVKVGQPFFLESLPQTLLLIDEHGKQWQLSTTRAETLRRPLSH